MVSMYYVVVTILLVFLNLKFVVFFVPLKILPREHYFRNFLVTLPAPSLLTKSKSSACRAEVCA